MGVGADGESVPPISLDRVAVAEYLSIAAGEAAQDAEHAALALRGTPASARELVGGRVSDGAVGVDGCDDGLVQVIQGRIAVETGSEPSVASPLSVGVVSEKLR
jgi:hypothetical protein